MAGRTILFLLFDARSSLEQFAHTFLAKRSSEKNWGATFLHEYI
jgi:hypothetical protein